MLTALSLINAAIIAMALAGSVDDASESAGFDTAETAAVVHQVELD